MTWCCSMNCTASRKKFPTLSFFRFPRDKDRCWKWVLNSPRKDLQKKAHATLRNYHLCAHHFEDSQFMNSSLRNKLVWNAVPTLFYVSKQTSADKPTTVNKEISSKDNHMNDNNGHGFVFLQHPYGSDSLSSAPPLRHPYGSDPPSTAPPLRRLYGTVPHSSAPPLRQISEGVLVPAFSVSAQTNQKSLPEGPCDNELVPLLPMTTIDAQIPTCSINDNRENEPVNPFLTDHSYYSYSEKSQQSFVVQSQTGSVSQNSLYEIDDVELRPLMNQPIPGYKKDHELKDKQQLDAYRRTINCQRRKISRLNAKVKNLKKQLEEAKTKTVTHLSVDDIIKLSAEYLSGPPLSFFASQLRASVASKRNTRRWMDADKQLCSSLYHQSPQIYNFMSKHFALPSVRCLQLFESDSKKEVPNKDLAEIMINTCTTSEEASTNLELSLGE